MMEVRQVRVCVPVTDQGIVDPRWGRAERLAIAEVEDGEVKSWEEIEVNWGEHHEIASEGQHHALVARFIRDQKVDAVVADHMGPGMLTMLERMAIRVMLGVGGAARQAVVLASPSQSQQTKE